MFSGSYRAEDVSFLLKNISLPSVSVEDKEKLIQSNTAHYSEMITHEKAPTSQYMEIFYATVESNGEKFAQHLYFLAQQIANDRKGSPIVLVSLARAGTPVGVIVKKILETYFKRNVVHYSVSIIRDKGLDLNALKFITNQYPSEDILFVDGWTGKGVIGQELKKSVEQFNSANFTQVNPDLYVVADISGTAHWGATSEDYLIPSAVLNSTVSGLISRTILNTNFILPHEFHGCVYYENLEKNDISNWFISHMMEKVSQGFSFYKNCIMSVANKQQLQKQSKDTIGKFLTQYSLDNQNFVKPGIGESTRVLLRRLPKELWIKDRTDIHIKHILHLAEMKNIPVQEDKNMCYNCVAIIAEID